MKSDKVKSVGVREVAVLAKVSFSTAAAALRGESWVKGPTRIRVEEAAAQLGYKRDVVASILSSRRGHVSLRGISIVYLAANFDQHSPGAFARRLPGLADVAKARGLLFERIELRDAAHAAQVENRLRATGVDGVILGPVDPKPFLAAFPLGEYAVVGDSRGFVLHGIDAVRANHFTAVQRLFLELGRRRYRRVGVILRRHRELHADDYARYGAVAAYRDLVGGFEKLEVVVWLFSRPEFDRERQIQEELHEFDRWQRKHRFDVVVGFDEREARLVTEACSDDPRRPDYAAMLVRAGEKGRLAGVAHDQEAMTRPLLDRLEDKIRGRQFGFSKSPVETVIDLPFLEGASLRRGVE